MSSTGDRIAALRRRRGWTQEHLAEVAGVTTRTIQRVECGSEPALDTLQALAAALDTSVSELQSGLTELDLARIEQEFTCPHCGALLAERTFVPHEYGDSELETFECGHVRGYHTRPCPTDLRFPKFEDYELRFRDESGKWWCYALPSTEMARQVHLEPTFRTWAGALLRISGRARVAG